MREVSGPIKKPLMHGLSLRQGKRMLVQVITVSIVLTAVLYATTWNRKRNIYRKFYENYDAEKEFERMRCKKLFDSC